MNSGHVDAPDVECSWMKNQRAMRKLQTLSLVALTWTLLLSQPATAENVSISTIGQGEAVDKTTVEVLSSVPTAAMGNIASELVHFVQYRNNIFLPVSVNGGKPCLFWVDTGGGTSFINSRYPGYQQLKQSLPKKHVIRTMNRDDLPVDTLTLYNCPTLKFAGVELRDTVVQMCDSDDFDKTIFMETGLEICGMLGTTALRALVSEIDYPNGTLRFFSPSTFQFASNTAKSCSFAVDPQRGNLPFVTAEVNGKTEAFDFDTGCSSALKVSSAILQDLGANQVNSLTIDHLRLGDLSLQHVSASRSRYPFSILGYGVLRGYRVTIDYSRNVIHFE